MNRLVSLYLLLFILSGVSTAAPANRAVSSPDLSRVRVSFVPNHGQTSGEYKYLLTGQVISAGFRGNGVDFDVPNASGERIRLPLQFGTAGRLEADEILPGKVNYLLGSDASQWRRNLPTYGRLRYRSVYPGVDLEFYGNPGELEHDFVVKPGADPAVIEISIPMTHTVEISADGGAVIRAKGAVLKFKEPVAYQDTPHGRVMVAAKFKVQGRSVGFEVGDYSHDLPLVIDPAVVFSTYIADANAPLVGVATDATGNTYVLGYTFSSNYPVVGAIQSTCNGCPTNLDSVITKLNASGTDLIFSTYLGGSQADQPTGIQVDGNGNVVVSGRTDSPDFPVKNGLPSGIASYVQPLGFITSLSSDGASVNFSTLLGKSPSVNITAMGMGADGAIYVSGITSDANFPITPGAIETVPPSYQVYGVFLTKFLPDGSLAYSGIVGNAQPQNGGGGSVGTMGIAVDAQGAAYLHGNAGQLWPTTAGAYQTSIPGTSPYAAPFVTKVSPDGSHIEYSTFLGPASGIGPAAITVNSAGEAWVTGAWAGPDFPITSDAYSNHLTTSGAPYLSKLSATGSALLYSTYVFGSISNAYPTAVKLDGAERVWIAGYTSEHGLPLLNPVQSNFDVSGQAGYVVEFDSTAKNLLFSSYFGAQSSSQIVGMGIDGANKVHVGGWTTQDLNTTPGAYRTSVAPPPQYVQYQYPFAAVLNPFSDVGTICITQPSFGGVYFPPTLVGTGANSTVTIKNCGRAALASLSFTLSDPQLGISSNACTGTIAPNASCDLTLVYTPSSETSLNATVTINGTGNVLPRELPVSGSGALPHATTYYTSVNFDPLLIGTSSQSFVFVMNSGLIPLHIGMTSIGVTGDYQFTTSNCAVSIPPGSSCLIGVTFRPTAAGDRVGALLIPTDDPEHSVITVTLNGKGVATYPTPVIDHLDFGTAPVGASDVSLSVSGSGFFPGSIVLVNGSSQSTTYDSYTQLRFGVEPSALANMTELSVTVVNPTPGGGTSNTLPLTVYKLITGTYNSMAFNRATGMLYATVPASAPADANAVLIIDPNTGQIQSRIATGGGPNAIAVSSDGQYLFVGLDGDHTVVRINCYTGAIERTFSLPIDSIFGSPDTIFQIVAVPGAPKSFVAALRANRSPSSDGVALFDDTGMVSHLPYDYPDWLETNSIAIAGNPAAVYAQPFETFGTAFFKTITMDSTGLHYTRPTGSYSNAASGNTVVSDGTLLYTDAGGVFDPGTQSKVGTFPVPSLSMVLPDPTTQRLFAFSEFDQQDQFGTTALSLTSFDETNFSSIGKLYIDKLRAGYWTRSLVRWGTDGFGLLTSSGVGEPANNILLLRSSLVTGQPAAQIPLVIGSLSPSQITVNSADLPIFLQGTGFKPETTASLNGVSAVATYFSGTELSVMVPASALTSIGTATITVSNPGGSSASASFQVVGLPQLSHSPNGLAFGSLAVNSSSAPKTITLTNVGSKTLNLWQVTASGDFTLTNGCGTTLAVGASCETSFVFTPTDTGTRSGSLTVLSDAADSPRVISLSGTGMGFQFNGTDPDNSATVSAGQTANYQLSLTSAAGFTGQVTLVCTGAPQYAACTVTPNSIAVDANSSPNVAVAITTSQTINIAGLRSPGKLLMLASIACGMLLFPLRRRARLGQMACLVVLVVGAVAGTIGLTSCGGGGGSTPPPPPATHYVARGTYNLQVKATSGTVSKTVNLTLVVR